MRKAHPQLEFEIEDHPHTFVHIEDALVVAVSKSISTGESVNIDVLTWTIEAAKHWAGDHGEEVYKEDPDASVHERIVIKAESLGRVA